MSTELSQQLTRLEGMRKAELQIEWRRQYKTDPPIISAGLLRRGIAYRLQEKMLGGLSSSVQAKLRHIAKGKSYGSKPLGDLKPGTRIVRQWNGQSIVVEVTETGFTFDDEEYGSLSEIACKITGAHWSGPRFFGLTKAKACPDA